MSAGKGGQLSELIMKAMGNERYERPFEYAFTFYWLSPLLAIPIEARKHVRILDVGCAESCLSKTLADLGFDVTGIDINDWDVGKAKFVKADLLEHEFPPESFHVIVAISTVEHVGLAAYGQPRRDSDGDIKTMEKIWRWLRRGGIAIVTLPFGRPHHPPDFERVYDPVTLRRRILRQPWEILDMRFAADLGGWKWCDVVEALFTDACVMLALRKP